MSKKYYYCELCDYICDTHYFHLTHEGSRDHINKCNKYKKNLINDEYSLGVFRKTLLDETGINYKNNDELCNTIIMYLSNYKITLEQINQIRDKNKQFEMTLINSNQNNIENSD